jgi:GT2 family glycosyltransferase
LYTRRQPAASGNGDLEVVCSYFDSARVAWYLPAPLRIGARNTEIVLMAPLVTVILPTYKRPDLLPACLDALEQQTHRPMEVIVIDQSPDSLTRDIMSARRSESHRYRYIHSDVAGVSLARNLGLREAAGNLIAFTDDDAVPEPGWISGFVRAFESTPADVVGGKILALWEGTRPRWFPDSRAYLVGIFDPGGPLAPFPEASLPMSGNMAVRRAVIENVGGFDEDAGLRPGRPISGEDSLFAWKAIGAGLRLYYQPEAVVHHRVPKSRMRRRYYLRRSYLEGVSLVDIEERRGVLTSERLAGMVRAHRKILRDHCFAAARCLSLAPWDDPRVLSHLGEAALSAGLLDSCQKVRRKRSAT